jgi:hypothetical protein
VAGLEVSLGYEPSVEPFHSPARKRGPTLQRRDSNSRDGGHAKLPIDGH